jgi:uncharacterized protein YjiS (DUF1127 family)
MTRTLEPTIQTSGPRAGQRSQERRPDTADVYLLARQMQSEAIAHAARVAVVKLARLAANGTRSLLRAWRQRRMRQRTLAELNQLDARALHDIGIDPHDITGAVDRLFAHAQADSGDRQAAPSGHDLGQTIRHVDQGMSPQDLWAKSRQDALELARRERAANTEDRRARAA